MKAAEILSFAPVNSVDEAHVSEIVDSIKANGWTGAPILVHEAAGMLITGSHRLAALCAISSEADKAADNGDWETYDELTGILEEDVAEDVSGIVEMYCETEDCTIDEIPFDRLSLVFGGTYIEQYASELAEW